MPGLRREEVAQLAMISTDYYTRLEQGRLGGASPAVLDALAAALRLGADERSYLYQLADKDHQRPQHRPRPERVTPQLRVLLGNLRDSPAIVLGRYLDILAWNQLATAVFRDFAQVPRSQRNFLRLIFLDPDFRGRFVDWEPAARTAVGFVRAATPYEPRLANLIGELSLSDTEFRTWWAERHASYATAGTMTYTHPLTGPYTLDWQALRTPDDSQQLIVWTAPPGSHSLDILHKLHYEAAPTTSGN